MSSFGKRVDGPNGRRWLKRKRVGIAASAVCRGHSATVLIENLSLTGARLKGCELLPGMKIALKVGDRKLSGVIAWAAGDRSGLRLDFAHPRRFARAVASANSR